MKNISAIIIAIILAVMRAKGETANIYCFAAAGDISCEHFGPFSTNRIVGTEGKFLFSYSNDIWRVQFTYQHPGESRSDWQPGITMDCKRIPDGIRQIIIPPANNNRSAVESKQTRPFATTQTIPYPDPSRKEMFLPWLCLCPNPELPFISSNRICFSFSPAFLGNPENKGEFSLDYISPDSPFLAKLAIRNNGSSFQDDGTLVQYPKPYSDGFTQFSYQVVKTTNYGGVIYPLKAVLREYLPKPAGKTSDEIYPVLVATLTVNQIAADGTNLVFLPVAAHLVALDSRPAGLNNKITVNYEVIDDKWSPLTNKRMTQLANFYRRQSFNRPAEQDKHSRNRAAILCLFVTLTLGPLAFLLLRKNIKKERKL